MIVRLGGLIVRKGWGGISAGGSGAEGVWARGRDGLCIGVIGSDMVRLPWPPPARRLIANLIG